MSTDHPDGYPPMFEVRRNYGHRRDRCGVNRKHSKECWVSTEAGLPYTSHVHTTWKYRYLFAIIGVDYIVHFFCDLYAIPREICTWCTIIMYTYLYFWLPIIRTPLARKGGTQHRPSSEILTIPLLVSRIMQSCIIFRTPVSCGWRSLVTQQADSCFGSMRFRYTFILFYTSAPRSTIFIIVK